MRNSNHEPSSDFDNLSRRGSDHFTSRKKKHHRVLWSILFLLLILLVGGSAWAYHAYNDAKNTFHQTYQAGSVNKLRNVSSQLQQGKPISILLLGTDTGALGRSDVGRTDTIIVATVNAKREKVTLTSIPRDTPVNITESGSTYQEKINAAYTIGGANTAVKAVQDLLDVPIDFYALVNMGGLEKMVDAVGGVDVTPPLTFKYGKANVTKGKKVHLTGREALDYSRMRHSDPKGDYGRQTRQRQVIEKLILKAVSLGSVTRYKQILTSISGNMKTDLTFNDMLTIATKYGDASHHMKSQHLQGTGQMINGAAYEVPSNTELKKVSNSIRKALGIKETTNFTTDADNSSTSTSSDTTTSYGSTDTTDTTTGGGGYGSY
ncbi:LCP family protein [Secundilactobacillus oryzae]|uniref:LCP family protein n=1 Tax=Secundilactobacillus oryzae TaxID=1202668 RepID=UPI0005572AA6|nr:LCP family protein [Secundilactobacillus oryzae]